MAYPLCSMVLDDGIRIVRGLAWASFLELGDFGIDLGHTILRSGMVPPQEDGDLDCWR